MTSAIEPRMVGARVARMEDPRFLKGEARYIANIDVAGARHARFVRSPLAHATITAVDTTAVPEGVEVFTGGDWANYGIECTSRYEGFQSATMPILAHDKVRYVGEPVAMVVASDPYLAEDAAEMVDVDYAPLSPITSVDEALDSEAALIHEDWSSNLYVPRAYVSSDYDEKTVGTRTVSGGCQAADIPGFRWREGRYLLNSSAVG